MRFKTTTTDRVAPFFYKAHTHARTQWMRGLGRVAPFFYKAHSHARTHTVDEGVRAVAPFFFKAHSHARTQWMRGLGRVAPFFSVLFQGTLTQ